MGGWNFAPRGYANCDGQLLPISQNTALFSLLGTTYGGDGRTTFALPDLRGRVALHAGTGPGLTPRPQGQRSGAQDTTLVASNLPNISVQTQLALGSGPGTVGTGDGAYIAANSLGETIFTAAGPGTGRLAGLSSALAGAANTSFNNMQPYLVIRYCIALVGIFPSRN